MKIFVDFMLKEGWFRVLVVPIGPGLIMVQTLVLHYFQILGFVEGLGGVNGTGGKVLNWTQFRLFSFQICISTLKP